VSTAALGPLTMVAVLAIVGSAFGQKANDTVVFQEEGKASYYGDDFQGKPTASGETDLGAGTGPGDVTC